MRKREKKSIILILLGLILSVSVAKAQNDFNDFSDYVADGDSALAEFRGMDALKAYQSALELDSGNIILLQKTLALIESLFKSKDIVYSVGRDYGKVAQSYIDRLNTLDSNSKETILARAQYVEIKHMSVHSHDPKDVTNRYSVIRSCMDAIPENAECTAMLGGWYLEQAHESPERRIRVINEYLKNGIISPSDSVILMQISWDSTIKYLELSHKLAPDHMGYAFLLGEVYFSRGDTSQAKDLFKKVDAMPARHFRDPQYKRSLANYKARLKIKN